MTYSEGGGSFSLSVPACIEYYVLHTGPFAAGLLADDLGAAVMSRWKKEPTIGVTGPSMNPVTDLFQHKSEGSHYPSPTIPNKDQFK